MKKTRRRTKQSSSLEERLILAATRLRDQAKGQAAGPEREELLRKARQTEAAHDLSVWIASPHAEFS